MLKLIAAISLCIGTSLSAQFLTQITIKVENAFGVPQSGNWTVDKFIDAKGRDWSKQFKGDTARVPLGVYRAVVTDAGSSFEGLVDIQAFRPVYWIAVKLGAYESASFLDTTIEGRIKAPPGRDALCRLNGLYIDTKLTTPVSADGTFRFRAPIGDYALTCDIKGEIFAYRLISINTVTSLKVLEDGKGALSLTVIWK